MTLLSTVYIFIEAFRKIDATKANGIPLWDAVLTYGFIAFLAVFENAIFSSIFAVLDSIWKGQWGNYLRNILRLLILFAIVITWGYLIYWTSFRNLSTGIKTFLNGYGILISLLLTLIIAWRFKTPIFNWIDETTGQFIIPSLVITILSLIFSLILLIDPLIQSAGFMREKVVDPKNPPNILLIYVDALTANDMSLYGYHLLTTPNLDEITKTWTVFTHAYSATTSSVANLPVVMTSRFPYLREYYRYGDMVQKGNGWLDLARIMKSSGYETIWQGFNSPGYYHLGAGFDRSICDNGFISFLGHTRYQYRATSQSFYYPFFLKKTKIPSELASNSCNGFQLNGIQNLIRNKEIGSEKPFFIYMHYPGVHGLPYPSGDYLGKLLPLSEGLTDEETQGKYYGEYSPEDQVYVDKLRLRYDEGILNADEKIAGVIKLLKDNNLYDNTMIVISADHGQNFYNEVSSHSTSLVSDGELHVPLLVKYPNQIEGKRINTLVSSTVDIMPTILDVVGIAYTDKWVDGKTLLESRVDNGSRTIYSRKNLLNDNQDDSIAAMQGNYKVVSREGRISIFDLHADPEEKNNLVNGYMNTDICYEARYKPLIDPKFFKIMDSFCIYIERMRVIRATGAVLDAPRLR